MPSRRESRQTGPVLRAILSPLNPGPLLALAARRGLGARFGRRWLLRLRCLFLAHVRPFSSSLRLGLRGRLLLAGDGLARPAARARVGAGALAAHGEGLAVAQPAV